MITKKSMKNAKKFCRYDVSLIEGYEEALNDPNEKYSVHHVLEYKYRTDELEAMNMYEGVHPDFLIWMPFSLHHNNSALHISRRHAGRNETPWNKGKTGVYSEETRKKMGESHKGKHPWNYKGGK
ncbi:MAG: hypothetical protein MJZ37_07090 [Bacilli bacterium]|nr:hypothetical protein [Bacilli bacterium]